jgi:hypothetical protein
MKRKRYREKRERNGSSGRDTAKRESYKGRIRLIGVRLK